MALGLLADAGVETSTKLPLLVSPARSARATTTSSGARTLAVLPFRYRGPEAQAYLGESLTDELVDTLSRTRGMKVLASGATARFQNERDARTVGRELGADLVVDGTVQRSERSLRITARLVDVTSGLQVWTDRFEGTLEDALALEEVLAKRIAEALRIELASREGDAPTAPEAMEFYLRGRRSARLGRVFGPDGTLELFGACLAITPGFRPAIAAYAVAQVRAWFIPGDAPGEREAAAREAVKRAVEEAADIAETHLAAAMLDTQTGRYDLAVRSLTRALEIAPTCAEALVYLGDLQCEAGRPDEGVRQLRLASELDPTRVPTLVGVARRHALAGDGEGFERVLTEMRRRAAPDVGVLIQLELRHSIWNGDVERLRRCRDLARQSPLPPMRFLEMLANCALGEVAPEAVEVAMGQLLATVSSPRFASVIHQVLAETYCSLVRVDLAMEHLRVIADTVLVDLEWLDHCPVFTELREHPDFAGVRTKAAARAVALWRA